MLICVDGPLGHKLLLLSVPLGGLSFFWSSHFFFFFLLVCLLAYLVGAKERLKQL